MFWFSNKKNIFWYALTTKGLIILQYFRPALSFHQSLRPLFCQFLSGFTVIICYMLILFFLLYFIELYCIVLVVLYCIFCIVLVYCIVLYCTDTTLSTPMKKYVIIRNYRKLLIFLLQCISTI